LGNCLACFVCAFDGFLPLSAHLGQEQITATSALLRYTSEQKDRKNDKI
jgi:hypothetical protein